MPLPTSLVVKKGSNTRIRFSWGMPGPLSRTSTITLSPPEAAQKQPGCGEILHHIHRILNQVDQDLVYESLLPTTSRLSAICSTTSGLRRAALTTHSTDVRTTGQSSNL